MGNSKAAFGAFIVSAKRASMAQKFTVKNLRVSGYTGPIYFIVGDDDPTINEYYEMFGHESVKVFTKDDEAQDLMQQVPEDSKRSVVVYARNQVDRIAQEIGLDYYIVLDDDYKQFAHRHPVIRTDASGGRRLVLSSNTVRDLDAVFAAMVEFLEISGALTVAMSQGGDMIGGVDNPLTRRGMSRKAMNSFVIKTGRPPKFTGWLNEDITMSINHGRVGDLVFTLADVQLVQEPTQKNSGGLTEEYLKLGTYVKSFYTFMADPSSVNIKAMGDHVYRIHHQVNWGSAVPKIISGKYRKDSAK